MESHLAAAVAKADAKIRLALPGGQLLLGGHQHEHVGLLAGDHFGQGGQGHGSGGHGSLDFRGGFVSVAAATKRSGAAELRPIVMENLGKENAPGRRRFASALSQRRIVQCCIMVSAMSQKRLILVKFGKRVRELRRTKGVSQEAFAAECGLDRTYISGIERGKRNVSLTRDFRRLPRRSAFRFQD